MALSDRKHVEAVALMRTLLDYPMDIPTRETVAGWLDENRPPPEAYMAALSDLAKSERKDPNHG